MVRHLHQRLAGLLAACSVLGSVPVTAQPVVQGPARVPRAHVLLVGDSTLATRTGYGDALCGLLQSDVHCTNLARGGRSSKSYRAEGLWDGVLAQIRASAGAWPVWILIQLGHNDQPGKPERSTDLATEFPHNMARYVQEAQQAGAQVVLLSPLTRRSFQEGQLQNDLRPWALAVQTVAAQTGVPFLDLNLHSAQAVQTMGQQEADTLAMAPPPGPGATAVPAPPASGPRPLTSGFDRTHLGSKGAATFSALVAELARTHLPEWSNLLRKQ